jgi:hypothetical protein
MIILRVLLQFNVYRLVVPHIHKMQRSAPLTNHLQVHRILRVIEASQLAVVYAEAVCPEMQNTLLRWALSAT